MIADYFTLPHISYTVTSNVSLLKRMYWNVFILLHLIK